MRRLLLAAAALALLPVTLGVAVAQEPLPPAVTVEVAPFEGPIKPLEEVLTTDVVVSVDCRVLADPPQQSVPVDLAVVDGPDWASFTMSPSRLLIPANCPPSTRVLERAQLIASTTADAPAFTSANLTVRATVRSPAGEVAGDGAADVEAGYFAILDARVPQAIRVGPPGVEERFEVDLTNFGNGDTRIEFFVGSVKDGWSATLPEPIVMGARQTGTEPVNATVEVGLTPAEGGFLTNEPGMLTVRVVARYAHAVVDEKEELTQSFLLTAKGDGAATAAPVGGAVLATLGAAALVAARRGGRA